jgi:hypothetical protein
MAGMKSRWFRFSLRTLLLLITALCVWLGVQVKSARRQRDAVANLLKAGAMVRYDYEEVPRPRPAGTPVGRQVSDTMFDQNQLQPGPAWLRKRIGDDYFRSAVAVWLYPPTSTIQKSDLDELANLPYIRDFCFDGRDTSIHEEDITALQELHQLEVLQLIRVRVNGSVLARLPNPTRLKRLSLTQSDIDDIALERIEKMTELRDLWLDGTHITDAGLQHLRSLKNLGNLFLEAAPITDTGLQHLYDLKTLTFLNLHSCSNLSEAGVSKLRAALPNANIVWP